MHQVGKVGESAHERDREPIADGNAETGLVLHVVRQMGQGVALGLAPVVGYRFVAAGERNWLEAQERNLLRIVESETYYSAHLLVVDSVDNRDDGHDVNAGGPEILDSAHLDIEEVPDGP